MYWFFIWLFIVVAVLGVVIWTLSLLLKQKKAMKIYAKKNSLEYIDNGFSVASTVQGVMKGRNLLITPETVTSGDMRGERKVTLIQVMMEGHMPTGGAIGTGIFRAFVEDLNLENLEFFSTHNFEDDGLASAKDKKALLDYLTDERVDAIKEVLKLDSVDFLYIFDENQAVLQVFTVDPLETPKTIDVYVKTLLKVARALEVVVPSSNENDDGEEADDVKSSDDGNP